MKEENAKNTTKGTIVEPLPNHLFRVEIESGRMVLAHMSDKMKMLSVRLIPGEVVSLEISEFDNNRARIIAKRKYQ